MLGSTEPRLWTPPLRELTPETSVGFAQNEWARESLRRPLYPWQEWLAIHAGELLPDGRPRFRIVLVLVARQNGKTEILVVLTAYWQFIDAFPLILGTSTKLDYARESWKKVIKLVARCEELNDLHAPGSRWYRETNGEQESWTYDDEFTGEPSRYKIAASNAEGGRSLTINRLVLDELRQHRTYAAWDAAEPATSAVWDAQIWALSNAGDVDSIVLNDHRDQALAFIEWWDEHGNQGLAELLLSGQPVDIPVDFRLGIFEWSAPADADPTDIHALAQANPSLNRRIDGEALLAKARRAVAKGGIALTGFQTEYMCINVKKLNPAVDPGKWRACLDIGDLSGARSRVALCFDVAPDELHATLAAAAVLSDGRVRGEVVAAWEGEECAALLAALPGHLKRVKPRAFGWLPSGPAAAFAAGLKERSGWPPAGITVEEIRGEVTAVCMGFAEQVKARQFVHSDDPLLNAHVSGAERLKRGDGWVFSRMGEGHCDAAYAMAGAVHLARTLPPPIGKPRLLIVEDPDD